MKELELLAKVHRLIKNRSIGTPKELAELLGISRSCLYLHIDKLKDMGAEIRYCKTARQFQYWNDFAFKVTIETPNMHHVIGGFMQKMTNQSAQKNYFIENSFNPF